MDDEARWQSLDETILAMRGRTQALETLVIEILAGLVGTNPQAVEIVTDMRNRMLSDLATAEGILRSEDRAVRQNEATHSALSDIFKDLLVALKHLPSPDSSLTG